MNIRLAKLYLALTLFCVASYLLWVGLAEWLGKLSVQEAPCRPETALFLSLLGIGVAGRIAWKTVIEELAVKSD